MGSQNAQTSSKRSFSPPKSRRAGFRSFSRLSPDEQKAALQELCVVAWTAEAAKRFVSAARTLRQSLSHHLFTSGPVRVDEAKNAWWKASRPAPVPEEWNVVSMRDVIEKFWIGGTPFTGNPEFWGGDIPWGAVGAIGEDDVFLLRAQRNITRKGLESIKKPLATQGMIAFSRRGTVGRAVVIAFDVALNQGLWGIRLSKVLDPLFTVYYIKTPSVQREIKRLARGTVFEALHHQDFFGLPVPVPPLTVQRQIVQTLFAADRVVWAGKRYAAALDGLLFLLMQRWGLDKHRGRRIVNECIKENFVPERRA